MAGDITEILLNWSQDRELARAQLTPAIYGELRKIAGALMRREQPGHTLQPTALVNEAYLRLVRQEATTWKDRAHFFGIAARIMRQVLVQHARERNALKRGGGARPAAGVTDEIAVDPGHLEPLLDLDTALERMASWDPRKLEIVELHYFGGLKAEEISEALDLTLATVRRDLLLGRAWLREQIR